MALHRGTRLGAYEIGESIGAGGMGEVYRARDTKLGREVAVKVLPEAFAKDRERLARFEREARLLASLNHPNIATIHGLDDSGDVRLLVMELVEGETLAERIAKGAISVDEAVPLFLQIAEALEAAHDKGVVHRDLKPANIKTTPNGKIKVLDFGLAKAFAEQTSPTDLSHSPTVTREGTAAGVILGTAAYMSPEQARGKKTVDKRTDIWAFGCCLYEALTGKAAFLGETVSDTIARILEREPPWDALPPNLRVLVKRCLRKDAHQRLHDIADARVEIEEALAEPAEAQEPEPIQSKRAAFIATAVIAGVTGFVVSTFLLPRSSGTDLLTHSAIPLSPALHLGTAPSIAISPDGRLVAYVGFERQSRQLYVRALDQRFARLVDGAAGARTPFFSPDGRWLGFYLDRKLMKVPISGGAPVAIAEIEAPPRGISWGPDGWIVFPRTWITGLSRVSADGGEPEVLTTLNRDAKERTHRMPEVLPGGKAVLFTIVDAETITYDDAAIAVLDLESGEYRVVLDGGMNPRYTPTGHLIYARGGSLLAVPFDLETLEPKGSPSPVLQGVATSPMNGNAEVAIARDGTLLYAPGESWGDELRVVWVDRGGRSEPLVETPAAYMGVRLSPDGLSMLLDVDGANPNIWIHDVARGASSRATFGFQNVDSIWTPDGSRLTFRSDREGPTTSFGRRRPVESQRSDSQRATTRNSSGPGLRMPNSWRSASYTPRPVGTFGC